MIDLWQSCYRYGKLKLKKHEDACDFAQFVLLYDLEKNLKLEGRLAKKILRSLFAEFMRFRFGKNGYRNKEDLLESEQFIDPRIEDILDAGFRVSQFPKGLGRLMFELVNKYGFTVRELSGLLGVTEMRGGQILNDYRRDLEKSKRL